MLVDGNDDNLSDFYYIIEGGIHFFPSQHSIHNIMNNVTVSLLSTASECLLVLLEEQGRIVSRKEMKERVWSKRGVVVSSNTFYQTMLNLRRGLEKAGAGRSVISTYYGKGVSIEEKVRVEKKSTRTVTDYNFEANAYDLLPTQDKEPYLIDEGNGKGNEKEHNGNSLRSFEVKVSALNFVNLILVLSCLSLFFLTKELERENFFDKYTKSGLKVKGCTLYSGPAQMSDNEIKNLISKTKLECEPGENLYLSSIYPVQRVSVIRCTGNFSQGDECESDYYLD
ncbi:hypothetical protein A3N42_19315 [Klebsiella aerogenes]|uniref:winged helix-turn-helix domain-containing protein n=1 Tax=Klebsiella aerogenes TaxID=548 RepID=UPI0007B337B4|nr:winged helix-turn-helix domain-containing protein [Klebsiella aerogenes]KZQ00379.1 hypothetical protein A3N42_19315 [Klebsiella aerogenes]